MSRRLDGIKASLNSQIQSAISAAKADNVLPSIQNTLEMQGRAKCTMMDRESNGLHPSPKAGNCTKEDRRSSGLQWNSKVENSQKTREIRPKTCFMHENIRQMSRQSSEDSFVSEQNRDTCIISSIFLFFIVHVWKSWWDLMYSCFPQIA